MEPTIFTVGHSTHPLAEFLQLLQTYGISHLVDIRTIPRSRHNPQFNRESLPASLLSAGIGYTHIADLGGLRKTIPDSLNRAWKNESFRGYADYMQTPSFQAGIQQLLQIASNDQVAIMCAEAVPWRCHRSLVADALTVRGVAVIHILGPEKSQPHKITPFARIEGTQITYPLIEEPPGEE